MRTIPEATAAAEPPEDSPGTRPGTGAYYSTLAAPALAARVAPVGTRLSRWSADNSLCAAESNVTTPPPDPRASKAAARERTHRARSARRFHVREPAESAVRCRAARAAQRRRS